MKIHLREIFKKESWSHKTVRGGAQWYVNVFWFGARTLDELTLGFIRTFPLFISFMKVRLRSKVSMSKFYDPEAWCCRVDVVTTYIFSKISNYFINNWRKNEETNTLIHSHSNSKCTKSRKHTLIIIILR